MKIYLKIIITAIFLLSQTISALAAARIVKVSGDVQVRRGVEETWQPAAADLLLEDIDTIWAGGTGAATLETDAGGNFVMGPNTMLDIVDLKKITKQELFLYLTALKVQKITPPDEKPRLRIGNVSVVHGESKAETGADSSQASGYWLQEKNGARALYEQKYYPNAVIKYHKLLDVYQNQSDCGELHFFLARALESLENTGQAVDAYQDVIKRVEAQKCSGPEAQQWYTEAQQALKRLKAQR